MEVTDSAGGRLIEAMMLLEMMLCEGCPYNKDAMAWAAHSLIQQVWLTSKGALEAELPDSTKELLAKIHADSAIENAMARRKNT